MPVVASPIENDAMPSVDSALAIVIGSPVSRARRAASSPCTNPSSGRARPISVMQYCTRSRLRSCGWSSPI